MLNTAGQLQGQLTQQCAESACSLAMNAWHRKRPAAGRMARRSLSHRKACGACRAQCFRYMHQQKQAAQYLLNTVCRLLALLASAVNVAVACLLPLQCCCLPLLVIIPIAAKASRANSSITLLNIQVPQMTWQQLTASGFVLRKGRMTVDMEWTLITGTGPLSVAPKSGSIIGRDTNAALSCVWAQWALLEQMSSALPAPGHSYTCVGSPGRWR
jgi:hypothetical protein